MNTTEALANLFKDKITSEILYEDAICIAFKAKHCLASKHAYLISKQYLNNLSEAKDCDKALLGHLMLKAKVVANILGLEKGFRIILNNGISVGQEVDCLHLHILGGRKMKWTLGFD